MRRHHIDITPIFSGSGATADGEYFRPAASQMTQRPASVSQRHRAETI